MTSRSPRASPSLTTAGTTVVSALWQVGPSTSRMVRILKHVRELVMPLGCPSPSTTVRRALTVFLCVQPLFWSARIARAQSIPSFSADAPSSVPTLSDPEVVRAERPPLNVSTVAPPALDAPLNPDLYVCGNGDVLELNFWGIQNFRLRVTIDLEGRAFVPKVGYVTLRAKTLTDARRILRDSVARFYPTLHFDATLAEPRTFLVQVVDDVVHPAAYPSRAIERVATVITKAGGLGPNASRRRIEIHRRDGSSLRADLLLYSQTGDVKYNPYLLDGDVVRVPFEELAASVGGAVNRPGRYELIESQDLAELLDLAGGLSPEATTLLPLVIVRRSNRDREDLKSYDFGRGGQLPSVKLQKEDAVRVSSARELQQAVTVIGAVAGAAAPTGEATRGTAPDEASATRRLPFVQGDTVRTLLERVGGVGPLADLTGSYLLRGGRVIPLDLYALVMLRDFHADRPVELGDTLVLPFKRRNVLVEGAVFAPGAYPYNPSFGIEEYLSLAGGRNRFAQSLSDVRLVTPRGEMKSYDASLRVEPGSSLVVPERNFSRAEVVQLVLSGVGIVLSGVAVVIAARK